MKKFVALFLAFVMLSLMFIAMPLSAQDEENNIKALTYKYLGTSPTGLNDYILLDEDGNVIDRKGLIAHDDRDRATIPTTYDLRNVGGVSYVTSVKNQNPYGTCWSFASVGALESNLIKQGLATTSIDLSELHTVYYAYTKDPNSSSTTYNDGKNVTGLEKFNTGGWASTAYGLWGSAEGVQKDVNAPYSELENTTFFTDAQRKESYYRVKKAIEIPYNNYTAVKENIMANGAMYLSFYWKEACYNAATASYYNPSYNSTNDPDYPDGSGGHAVLVVGWNNNYPASNFATNPGSNGAWLCRNSWGSSFGNSGYFWISYEDFWITGFTSFIGETNDNYDNYNQYERTGYPLSLLNDKIYLANVFTASQASTLEAVAFRMESIDGTSGTAGFDYTINVYTGLSGTVTNPTSGSLSATITGHSDFGGYITEDLSSPLSLAVGAKYSIVIKCTSSSAIYDGLINFGAEKLVGSTPNEGTNTISGRSFWSSKGTTWVDTYGTAAIDGFDFDGNFPIKALTNDIDTNYTSIRAQVQTQLDQTEGATQGSATSEQWSAFTTARTFCGNVVNSVTASKADLNNALIRMKLARDGVPISYLTSNDYTFSISNGVATITAYNGTAATALVPKALNGCSVVIGAAAFNNKTNLKTVYILGSPISIASAAFSGCTNLKFVYFSGNAPAVTGSAGSGSPIGIKTYYKYGTTGWTNSPWSGNSTAVVPGDINGDNAMNMTDAVQFVQKLAQTGSYSDTEFAAIDITRDGAVNMSDIVKLVQALANTSIVLP